MANTKSAKKDIRNSAKKAVVNLKRRRDYKTIKKEVLDAVSKKDIALAQSLLPKAFKSIDKASKINVLHKNTASRLKSRLDKSIKKLG